MDLQFNKIINNLIWWNHTKQCSGSVNQAFTTKLCWFQESGSGFFLNSWYSQMREVCLCTWASLCCSPSASLSSSESLIETRGLIKISSVPSVSDVLGDSARSWNSSRLWPRNRILSRCFRMVAASESISTWTWRTQGRDWKRRGIVRNNWPVFTCCVSQIINQDNVSLSKIPRLLDGFPLGIVQILMAPRWCTLTFHSNNKHEPHYGTKRNARGAQISRISNICTSFWDNPSDSSNDAFIKKKNSSSNTWLNLQLLFFEILSHNSTH